MAEYFSNILAVHVKKGIDERARQGNHLGAIPFGYESCWKEKDGERVLRCKKEHPGGIHVHSKEGPAVASLDERYFDGIVVLFPQAAEELEIFSAVSRRWLTHLKINSSETWRFKED